MKKEPTMNLGQTMTDTIARAEPAVKITGAAPGALPGYRGRGAGQILDTWRLRPLRPES